MSSTYASTLERVERGLDELATIDPAYRTTAEKQGALVGLSRIIARAEAERMRVLAAADDVVEATGARSTAAWLAVETRDAVGSVNHSSMLADAMDARWRLVGEVFATGAVNLAQVRVMVEALDALPAHLTQTRYCVIRPSRQASANAATSAYLS